MPQSLVQIYVHLVFSTKHRQPFLLDPAFRDRTHAYLIGICQNQDSPTLRVGGVEDHVHMLCRLSKTLDVSALIRELKRDSSKWIKAENAQLGDFHWQEGYGAFSVSPSHRSWRTSPISSNITSKNRSKTNTGDCVRNIASTSMNNMFGIDLTPQGLHSTAQGRRLCGAPWVCDQKETQTPTGFHNSRRRGQYVEPRWGSDGFLNTRTQRALRDTGLWNVTPSA
jgi:REP element-mobilizing transposase RayT